MSVQSSNEKLKKGPYYSMHDIKQKYGINQGAEISPDGEEVTEEQEYKSNGLPASTKYAVDKETGRPIIVNPKQN